MAIIDHILLFKCFIFRFWWEKMEEKWSKWTFRQKFQFWKWARKCTGKCIRKWPEIEQKNNLYYCEKKMKDKWSKYFGEKRLSFERVAAVKNGLIIGNNGIANNFDDNIQTTENRRAVKKWAKNTTCTFNLEWSTTSDFNGFQF